MGKMERGREWFNFEHSINSEHTKRQYVYCLKQFLIYYKLKLDKFLKLKMQQQEQLIIKYLVQKKGSKAHKNVIFFTIKHACEVNDVLLNWRKLKKFIKSEKTGNEIAGKDRGYEHKEIQTIVGYADQRVKTAILILASTGMRVGALPLMKIGDLERIQDLYKFTVYPGDREQYTTFCTPECAKEINAYLEYRIRRGVKMTDNSFLLIKMLSKSEPFKGISYTSSYSFRALLQHAFENSGLREIDHKNPYKHKQVPLLHGFRKFTTKQLVDSNVKAEIREMLLGHKIGLTSVYYKPTEQEMLNEYLKAVPLLTISNEERLKFKLEQRITIERTQLEQLRADFDKFKKDVMKRRK